MSKVKELINEFKKTRTETRRTRYPKLELHPTFEKVLNQQINLLRKKGLSDSKITDRLQRAIPFYVDNIEN